MPLELKIVAFSSKEVDTNCEASSGFQQTFITVDVVHVLVVVVVDVGVGVVVVFVAGIMHVHVFVCGIYVCVCMCGCVESNAQLRISIGFNTAHYWSWLWLLFCRICMFVRFLVCSFACFYVCFVVVCVFVCSQTRPCVVHKLLQNSLVVRVPNDNFAIACTRSQTMFFSYSAITLNIKEQQD